jgi:hypothetical protein
VQKLQRLLTIFQLFQFLPSSLKTTFTKNQKIKDLFLHLGAAEDCSTLSFAALTCSKHFKAFAICMVEEE